MSRQQLFERKNKIIGWREWVELPGLNLQRIKVKIDTGARTSALHAMHIKAFEQDGQMFVRFLVHPNQKQRLPEIECIALVLDQRQVKNSSGVSEKRYVIRTPILLGDKSWEVDITLTNRSPMGFRMLLGRTAIRNKYIVDPGHSFILTSKDQNYSNKK
ncbi:MAG: RimK/LysX family protein [Magnetococcus sp. DMHC-6]